MILDSKVKRLYSFRRVRFARTVDSSFRYLRLWLQFRRDFATFRHLSETDHRFRLSWSERQPRLYEKTTTTTFDHHYVLHTAWAARVIAKNNPKHHVDISSSLYFSALVSAFVPISFYDYRPADLRLSGLSCGKADLLDLPFEDSSVRSLSCMHVVEHVGLGRYGEPLNPTADLKAMSELKRVLAPGGSLLFVVPIGKPRIVFNAHRIYSQLQIADAFRDLRLRRFDLITDDSQEGLLENASVEQADSQSYGCGCFWFQRG